jgi:hypothetical protein
VWIEMAVVSVRVSDEEKKTMLDFAKFHGETVSKLLRDIFFERLEDEYDVQVASEYQAERTHVNHEWNDVKEELGFE